MIDINGKKIVVIGKSRLAMELISAIFDAQEKEKRKKSIFKNVCAMEESGYSLPTRSEIFIESKMRQKRKRKR